MRGFLAKVTGPFKHGHFFAIHVRFLGCNRTKRSRNSKCSGVFWITTTEYIEYPPGNDHITPFQGTFEDFCSFPLVGYVSSMEGVPKDPWDDCIFTDPWMVDVSGINVGKYSIHGASGYFSSLSTQICIYLIWVFQAFLQRISYASESLRSQN